MSIWESRLRLAALAAASVALSLTGCEQISKESALDKTASLPAMRTHCVGRYLIDLPADFEQMLVSDVELTYGMDKNFRTVNVTVARAAGSQPSFDGIVNKRASELAADYHFKSPSKTMLAFRQRLNETTALVRSYDSPDMLDYFKAELFAEKGFSVGLFKADIFKTDTPDDIEAKVLKVVERTSFAPSPDQAGRGAVDRGTLAGLARHLLRRHRVLPRAACHAHRPQLAGLSKKTLRLRPTRRRHGAAPRFERLRQRRRVFGA